MKFQAVTAPDWLARNAIYQINPRTFSPEGTISAITKTLPELKGLGFNIIYLCPIFEEDPSEDRANWSIRQKRSETNNPKNPYRMNDYFKIDEEYGTLEDLRELIDTAHAMDMRVLLDLVYLHIGPNAPILKRHPEFAKQDEDGNTILTRWFFPHLDFTCPGLREYLLSNMVFYVGELDADGFRCDVGDGVPIDFWNEGRRRIQAIKSDAVLINEGRNWDYLLTGFDASYFFWWHETLYYIFGGVSDGISGQKPSTSLEELRRGSTPENFPAGGLLLRDIDNHDTVTDWPARIERVAGHDGMELIEVINYLIDGIPMVYCGNELADEANLSMFANRFHMGKFEVTDRRIAKEAYSVRRQEIMKTLNRMKQESDILRYGKTVWLPNSADDKVLSFARDYKGNKITLIGNVTTEPLSVTVDTDLGDRILMSRGGSLLDGAFFLEGHGYLVLEHTS
ncbi:MAG: hypothetical protein IKZ21_04830 [Clostridia bacterium]|nr:hypothetical protein [Clostridia bacterium]